jgi:hypothetical protein
MKRAFAAIVFLALAPAVALDERQAGLERMRADLEFLCSPPLEGRASRLSRAF